MRLDLDLVRRVEHSAAEVGARQALALATRSPSSGAAAEPCDGGSLLSFGHGRYVNRAVGLGLGGTDAAEIVAALDRFYDSRSMPPSVEISPWATEDLLGELASADYRLERFRNVYVRALASLPEEPEVSIVRIDAGSTLRHHILAGDTEPGSEARRISDEYCDAAGFVDGAVDLVALVDAEPAACGSLNMIDGVGWLGGAATLSAHRGRGLQSALVARRLRLATEHGCTFAAATALPDGQSARNLERLGFRLAYTQAVLTRRGSRAGASASGCC